MNLSTTIKKFDVPIKSKSPETQLKEYPGFFY